MKSLKQGAAFIVGVSTTKSPAQCQAVMDSCLGLVTPYQKIKADSSRYYI